MNVNGITTTSSIDQYINTKKSSTQKESSTSKESSTKENAIIYEPSSLSQNAKIDKDYILKLKADSEQKVAQFKTLVENMLSKQLNSSGITEDMWKILSGGDFTVDGTAKANAQAEISEDGYWGVKQTSDRIIDFAMALTGGDINKMEEMRSAFEKGFQEAEKTWGGKLPEISQKTYQAVMEKFDNLTAQS